MNQNSVWDNINVLSPNNMEPEIKDDIADEMDAKSFKVKNYIPTRFNPRYFNPYYIAAGVATILIIIIIVIVANVTSTSTKGSKNSDQLASLRKVIINDGNKLWSYDSGTKNLTLILETKNNIGSFYYHDSIFWSENDTPRVLSATSETSDVIFQENGIKPHGLAMDYLGENIYMVDSTNGHLIVVHSVTKDYCLLLTDLINPKDVHLDPPEGIMFILQYSHSVIRGNMDGTSLKTIIENGGITALAIDRHTKRLYWVNEYVSIEGSDYEGKSRFAFLTDTMYIEDLGILRNSLYWVVATYGKKANLMSCKIVNDTCQNYSVQDISPLKDPKSLQVYDDQSNEKHIRSCSFENGGCEHICLPIPNNGHSCVCKLGYQLNPDKSSCRQIRDIIIYTYKDKARGRILDTSKTTAFDAFFPMPYKIASIKEKGEIDFDYDLRNDDFYFSDDSNIYKMKLKQRNNQTIILSVNISKMCLEDLAFDWITGNMYFSMRSTTFIKRHELMVFNVKRGPNYQKSILSFRFDSTFGLQACPYAMVIHPGHGYLFFTAGENNLRFIQRSSTNGTNISRIHNSFPSFVHEFRLIAIDYSRDRIYWIWDSDTVSIIKHSNYDGSDIRSISVETVRNAKTIYVHQQWLYISNLTSIWRVHKETGLHETKIAPYFEDQFGTARISGVRVVSEILMFVNDKDNPCANDSNGGCEQFCFYAEGNNVSCDCKDGQNIRNDGKCY